MVTIYICNVMFYTFNCRRNYTTWTLQYNSSTVHTVHISRLWNVRRDNFNGLWSWSPSWARYHMFRFRNTWLTFYSDLSTPNHIFDFTVLKISCNLHLSHLNTSNRTNRPIIHSDATKRDGKLRAYRVYNKIYGNNALRKTPATNKYHLFYSHNLSGLITLV